MTARKRRKPRKPGATGGSVRNERSLANLRNRGVPPGNSLAVKHGAYARVVAAKLDSKAREVYDALAADAPLRGDDGGLPTHDAAMVRLLADVLCRLDSVGAWLDGRWATDEGQHVLEIESKLRREAADYLDAMGMSPRSRAKLGLDVQRAGAFDLALTMAAEAEAEGKADADATAEDDDADPR
jgi:hypothetical protein